MGKQRGTVPGTEEESDQERKRILMEDEDELAHHADIGSLSVALSWETRWILEVSVIQFGDTKNENPSCFCIVYITNVSKALRHFEWSVRVLLRFKRME